MIIRLVSGFFGILLNVLLLPKFGLWAVGFSALASQLLYLLLSCVIKIKSINWTFPTKAVLKGFSAVVICFVVSLLARKIIHSVHIIDFMIHTFIFFGTYATILKFLPFFKSDINEYQVK